jgi:hypothetical protein
MQNGELFSRVEQSPKADAASALPMMFAQAHKAPQSFRRGGNVPCSAMSRLHGLC